MLLLRDRHGDDAGFLFLAEELALGYPCTIGVLGRVGGRGDAVNGYGDCFNGTGAVGAVD